MALTRDEKRRIREYAKSQQHEREVQEYLVKQNAPWAFRLTTLYYWLVFWWALIPYHAVRAVVRLIRRATSS